MASEVNLRVPGLLSRFTDGARSVTVRASTVKGCIDALLETHPALAPHLRDGRGRLREHLVVLHEGVPVDEADAGEASVAAGDEVVILQAVSGG